MQQLAKLRVWKSLEDHAQLLHLRVPKQLVKDAVISQPQFNASSSNIHLNYANQLITPETIKLLIALAHSCELKEKINSLLRGDNINISENRPALHTALRASGHESLIVNDKDIIPEIMSVRKRMQTIVEQIRAKQWLGFSGKPITDIVNIGIGGSDLGPRFCLQALKAYTTKDLNYYFISDADPSSFENTIAALNPETTLFIISSKSFTTQETLYNAKKAMEWIGNSQRYAHHFIAVTAETARAQQLGIKIIFPIWEWVGGRYSFCSAINLIAAIAIGFESFNQMLLGAQSMDKHFAESNFETNLPVLLALLGIWNNNFLHIHNLLMLTYTQRLEYFVPYIQQLDMESNGKSIDNQEKIVNYATGPIVWGGLGNQAQHSYFQLLCQGTHKLAADFLSLDTLDGEIINDMCHAQINLLANGVHAKENANGYIPGNIPINHIRLKDCSPYTIGALVALYEHKVFAQSVIWNINPFDQPGVESAKKNYGKSSSPFMLMPS